MKNKKKRKKRKKGGFGRGLYRTLVAISALIVALFAIYKLSAQKLTTSGEKPLTIDQTTPTDDPDTAQDESQQAPGLERKDATWTFLLCAEDQVSGSTDVIMVCTYDTKNQKVGLVSIPRDTLVDRPGWKDHKINAMYAAGKLYDPPDGGVKQLRAAVSEVLGIPIDYYAMVDTKLFVALVDAVNGVDFNVPVHMSYDAPDQNLHIHYEPGMQHLTGQQALEVVRCRKNSDGQGEYPHNIYDAYPDADVGRTRTQQEMLKTIAKKVLQNPQKAPQYVELMSKYVKTDLSLGNLLWLVQPALKFDFANLTTATLPGDGSKNYKGTSWVYELDIEGSLSIINDCLNPYTTPVTEDMVRMPRGE